MSNVLVVASDEQSRAAATAVGLAAVHSAAFGDMPERAARAYGDSIFSSMMWMKTICVWLVVRLGYDVLFQDADIVWFRDPWPYLEQHHAQHDTVWMDDAARSERFGPYYTNSGFYLIRNNARGLQFTQELLFHTDEIIAAKSHQAVVSSLLSDAHSRFGLSVAMLESDMFTSGAYFHYRMNWMRDALLNNRLPYVFHMCWTSNKEEKMRFLKTVRWWFRSHDKCADPLKGHKRSGWEAFVDLRRGLDRGKSIEQRIAEERKADRPFVITEGKGGPQIPYGPR